MADRGTVWRRWLTALAVVAACLYLPFSWLLWIDYSWNSNYWLFWLRLWPILPGFLGGALPGAVLLRRHLPDAVEFSLMGVTTLLLLMGLTWLGAASRRRLLLAAGLALGIAVPTAYIAYVVFAA